MQSPQSLKTINNEKGMVLVVSVMLVAVLVLLGTTAIMTTTTDMKISSNYKEGTRAFYNAEAGVATVIAYLRTNTVTFPTVNAIPAIISGGTCPTSQCTPVPVTVPSEYAFSNPFVNLYGYDVANKLFVFRVTGTGSNNASRTIEAYIRNVLPIPGGCRAAVTTNSDVGILGTIVVDGRDHDINGNLISGATSGKYGVATVGDFTQGGNGMVGGTNTSSTSYAPLKPCDPSTVQEFATWTPPLTPDAALGLPEGTLKAYAQSGANGSQYVTNPALLANPQALSGVTYLELPSGGTWQSMDFGNSSGILIVHNSDRSAIVKNSNAGTFKGIVIVDDYVHSHNNIIGAAITLSTAPSSGNVLGNGSGSILYSTAAIGAAFSSFAGVKVVAWHDMSI
jgi:Tfp pilus assembly protein PilX